MKRKKFIEIQKLTQVNGDVHSYDVWVGKHTQKAKGKLGDRFDYTNETPQANPDCLREDEAMYSDSQLSKPQELMGEAVEHLQGLQRDCYMLTMRQGLSFTEAGKLLKLSKSDVQGYRARAVKFVTEYIKRAIKNGRLDAY